MIELTEEQAAQPWRFWLAVAVLVLAGLGGVAAAMYEPPSPVTCVVTTSGQSLCPMEV